MLLTKTEFLRYQEAPLHLWASLHNQLEKTTPDDFSLHLMRQGQIVEELAQAFLPAYLANGYPGAVIQPQAVVVDGNFYARVDALVQDPASGAYDLFEIKSSLSVKDEQLEDTTFQALVIAARYPLRRVLVVHLNDKYVRQGALDLNAFFQVEDVSDKVAEQKLTILAARSAAWEVARLPAADGLGNCSKPGDCPCPSLCFPNLPVQSIFSLPRLGKKARELQDRGILALADIPPDVRLSSLQTRHRQATLNGSPIVDLAPIQDELDQLAFPLYFLDYETYNPAVPLYDGYAPYEHMVFQYSLHIVDSPHAAKRHAEFLAVDPGDPEPPLLESLAKHLGPQGSVIVWNKQFEMERNREMAQRLPQFRPFLEGVNQRVYDLMEIFRKGYYVDGRFRGSASIKNVLPALAPDLDYSRLPIGKGDKAMLEWSKMTSGQYEAEEAAKTARDLLQYCELDTLAMVRIWEFLRRL